jgi:hypothetical protein
MKKLFFICVVLPIIMVVTSCDYQGDGEYRTHGFWPFKVYELVLPEFEFRTGKEQIFQIKGYHSHGKSLLTLVLLSDELVSYKELDTIVELHISRGPAGVTYFYRKSALNAHYRRMYAKGEKLWANELEWDGEYQYSAYYIDDESYSSSSLHPADNTKEMTYSHFMPTEATEYYVKVKIGNVPSEYENIKARIQLQSGWK